MATNTVFTLAQKSGPAHFGSRRPTSKVAVSNAHKDRAEPSRFELTISSLSNSELAA